jgi:hypothetical protein
MSDRQSEAWETSAAGPYAYLPRERGEVTIWALDNDRHRVRATGEIDVDRVVYGHGEAHEVARVLAERMGDAKLEGWQPW